MPDMSHALNTTLQLEDVDRATGASRSTASRSTESVGRRLLGSRRRTSRISQHITRRSSQRDTDYTVDSGNQNVAEELTAALDELRNLREGSLFTHQLQHRATEATEATAGSSPGRAQAVAPSTRHDLREESFFRRLRRAASGRLRGVAPSMESGSARRFCSPVVMATDL